MHNNLHLDPRTHIKRLCVWYISYPATEEVEAGRWLGFPGQLVLLNSRSRERPCLSKNKTESHQSLNFHVLTHSYSSSGNAYQIDLGGRQVFVSFLVYLE